MGLPCSAGFSNITIMPNGDIYSCYMLSYDNRFYMGNIINGLNNYRLFKVQNFLKYVNVKTNIDQCRTCDIMKICNACLGDLKFGENGKVIIDNYACNYYLGLYEGFLVELNDIMLNDIKWKSFKENLRKMKEIVEYVEN
ncbi:SPASM domain-containing protein [Acidianus brierleyi]|uniref:SPASM domain-containing protein n=1 Tax=Acidianus brierleyi TaxID=41673 RepID=UPI001442E624|nr:SPASM domain-containing protein [Acidianus brierleyi]AWR95246.2 SPASM domain-containing protein [Acidianus brierleyi]